MIAQCYNKDGIAVSKWVTGNMNLSIIMTQTDFIDAAILSYFNS
jgi:hypothetical protein